MGGVNRRILTLVVALVPVVAFGVYRATGESDLMAGDNAKERLAEIAARPDRPGRPHGLPGPLIVSLTSHAARFATLAPTLRALTRQTGTIERKTLAEALAALREMFAE